MLEFPRIKRLPIYVFSVLDQLKAEAQAQGKTVYDFGLGNPDMPTPQHIVDALVESVKDPATHRYSAPRGILPLRAAICNWYGRRYNVDLNPANEAIVTIGSKEGLAHLALAAVEKDDVVLVPNPCYPVHHFGYVIADAQVVSIPCLPGMDFIAALQTGIKNSPRKPKLLVINFPSNPTAQCVDLDFFTQIVEIAREHNILVIHDLAYADITFDDYQSPSILQVPGAKEVAVESYTLSKTYNMPGWRVGFMCGNNSVITALSRIKAYLDYGLFAPIQAAAIAALEGPRDCVQQQINIYQARRDILCSGLRAAGGWEFEVPRATMFVWARIPQGFRHLGSLEFAKLLLNETGVAASPGMGFGEYGDEYLRFSLVEDAQRTVTAMQNIQAFMRRSVPLKKVV